MNTIHRDRSNGILRGLSALAVVTTLGVLQGCQIFGVASVIGQNIEREKKVEVHGVCFRGGGREGEDGGLSAKQLR